MSTTDRKAIQISSEDYEKLKQRFERERKKNTTNESFGPWVSKKIGQMADKENWIDEMFPDLTISGVDKYGAMIRDHKDGKLSEVKSADGILTCITCANRPRDCRHALLVQASLDTTKIFLTEPNG